MGAASLNAWYGLAVNRSGFKGFIETTGEITLSATGGTLGFGAVSRTGSTDVYWVRDGGSVNTTAQASSGGIPNAEIYLGILSGVGLATNRSFASTGFSSGLSPSELENLRDIINTFESALTR